MLVAWKAYGTWVWSLFVSLYVVCILSEFYVDYYAMNNKALMKIPDQVGDDIRAEQKE